jgi:alkylated DNA repair dioxygenase AlkB
VTTKTNFSFWEDILPGLTFEEVDAGHSWVNRDDAPRDECFMSDWTDKPYTYGSGRGVRTYLPIEYSETVSFIRARVAALTGVHYEACFSNKYEGPRKHLGWHADDSDSIDHNVGIAVVSFGAEREIWFRENFARGQEAIVKRALPHGSLIVMPAGFQQTHQHRIPKHGAECGPRISLTFRKLIDTGAT